MADASELPLVKLLGNEVVDNKGNKTNVSDLVESASAVGIYFSAHWCGPCRGFTPVLAKAYPKLKKDKKFEVVFVSSDRDEASFHQYHGEMPWKAIPFSDRARKAALSAKFKVQGIPTFIILDPKTGKVINKDGRSAFGNDPEGENYPWAPKTVKELITKLENNAGQQFTQEHLQHKKVGIYFSAHWCPPCRGFTPQLVKTYKKLKAENKDFEVIFVSSDQSEGEFKEYFHEMPWLAVPFSDRRAKSELSDLFGVEGIPTFIVLDWDTGKVINAKARAAVGSDPDGREFPWAPKPVSMLSRGTASDLNEIMGLIAFSSAAESKNVLAALTTVANEVQEEDTKNGEEEPTMAFFVDDGSEPMLSGKIKELMQLGNSAKIGILNIPGGNTFASDATEITADTVRKFVKAVRAGTVSPTSLE